MGTEHNHGWNDIFKSSLVTTAPTVPTVHDWITSIHSSYPSLMNDFDTFKFTSLEGLKLKVAKKHTLLEFANKVREAGGGTPLQALMPAIPQNKKQCLIARALNFSSEVYPSGPMPYSEDRFPSGARKWVMDVRNDAKAIEIAKKVGLDLRNDPELDRLVLVLPEIIGNAAYAFDLNHPEFAGLTEKY